MIQQVTRIRFPTIDEDVEVLGNTLPATGRSRGALQEMLSLDGGRWKLGSAK